MTITTRRQLLRSAAAVGIATTLVCTENSIQLSELMESLMIG